MKRLRILLSAAAVLAAFAGWAGAAPVDADITRFIDSKSNHIYRASQDEEAPVPPEVWKMFSAASAGKWADASNLLETLKAAYAPFAPRPLPADIWFRVQDVGGICSVLSAYDLKFCRLFAEEVFKTIPRGSIYFGGTDPGRFAITALSVSHEDANPFFTLTQNQLADTNYLKYVRALYRQQIVLPDDAKVSDAFSEYLSDVQRRSEHDKQYPNEPKQIVPGEEVKNVNGRLQVTGQAAVMMINGILVRDILQANPDRDFYLEESLTLEWMYPYFLPAGPIVKLRHAPSEGLFAETVRNDREYWQKLTRRLIGLVVHNETSVAEVCAMAQDLNGVPQDFEGDPAFLRDSSARGAFSKLRSSISGLYLWRAAHSRNSEERRDMQREADLACKQAYLLYPKNPQALWRYANLLATEGRVEDMQKLIEAARKLNPEDATVNSLSTYAKQLSDWQRANK